MLFDGSGAGSGFGATPFGTYFGAGSGGLWGLFESTFRGAVLETSCEACGRVRLQKRLGGCAVFGLFILEGTVGLAVSDALRPTSCYALKISGPDGTYEVTLSFSASPPPPIVATPPVVTAPVPPVGADTVNTVLSGLLPEIAESGFYTFTLVDRCCGCETPLAAVYLEGSPMLITPQDADIGGAPRRWLYANRVAVGAAQPAAGTRPSIPFDKCTVVAEYDSRTGVLPDITGWTRTGTGAAANWALVPGGALRLSTLAPDTNYYVKTISLAAAPPQIYAYGTVLPESVGVGAVEQGFEISALYAGAGFPYEGARIHVRETPYFTQLSGGSDVSLSFAGAPEWLTVGAGDGSSELAYERAASGDITQNGSFYGLGAIAPATELVASFGVTDGTLPVNASIRDIVISDGRFIRARFTGLSQVSAPKLRLYVSAELGASAAKTARFKVQYGTGSGAAYGPELLVASSTVNLTVANTVYELAFSLPGLVASQPFWFSVERDWNHVDDLLDSTVHLLHMTVRGQ